jgi:aryl-alcohol dehydrogenase-like predicted oxidoreductase
MRTQQLGHTGKDVSALCLGAMFFGSRTDKETSYRVLDHYLDAGGTFIDTANTYARWIEGFQGGESETLLGEWMTQRGNRSALFIASKVGFDYQDVSIGLSARQIEEECNKSLKRMNIETIDLYYAHKDDPATPLEETMEAFDRLISAGKVRFIGASNYLAWRLERARWISETNSWAQFCCIQQRHTYLPMRPGASSGRQDVANNDLFQYCSDTGTTLLAYSVLLGGAYTRDDRPLSEGYISPDNEQRLAVLHTVAREIGATPNQVVLCWMMQSSPPVLPLIAASSEEQLAENIGALALELSAEQMRRLNNAGTE